MAQLFDERQGTISDEPRPLTDAVGSSSVNSRAGFSASDRVLVHRSPNNPMRRLVWFDRSGRQLGQVGQEDRFATLALSPDGNQLAAEVDTSAENTTSFAPSDVWLLDLRRNGVGSRLTREPDDEYAPIWSKDGAWIYYGTRPVAFFLAQRTLMRAPADGGDSRTLVLSNLAWSNDQTLTPDGQALVVATVSGSGGAGMLQIAPLDGSPAEPLIVSPAIKSEPRFSPDGHWLAYRSDEAGHADAYLQPWPLTGRKWRITQEGAGGLRWNPKGGELFYGSFTGDVMSVTIAVGADGAPFFGVPRKLFSAPGGSGFTIASTSPYDVAPDGERFLVALPTGTLSGLPPISVTLNWQELLKTDTAP